MSSLYPFAPDDAFQVALNDDCATDVAAVATGSNVIDLELNVPEFSIVPSRLVAATSDPDPTEMLDPAPIVIVL
jgi:hypothetical protein